MQQKKTIMHLKFTSKITSYNEAIDGEIIQVLFEEYENEDAFNQTALYLLLSMSYEFPPFKHTIEWFDGRECNGGAEILNYKLTRHTFQLWLNNGLSFDVSFKTNETTYKNIDEFLKRITQNIQNA